MRKWVICAGAALALAACNDAVEPADAPATEPEAETAAAADGLAAGLWDLNFSGGGVNMGGMRLCSDGSSDAAMMTGQSDQDDCSQMERGTGPDGEITFSMVCAVPQIGDVTYDGALSGDFQTTYAIDMTVTLPGGASQSIHGEATRAGDCPEGMPAGAYPAGVTVDASGYTPE